MLGNLFFAVMFIIKLIYNFRNSLISHSLFKRVTEDELNKFTENLKKEINKRRLILEHQAEEEIGIQTPWRRTRTKSIKR